MLVLRLHQWIRLADDNNAAHRGLVFILPVVQPEKSGFYWHLLQSGGGRLQPHITKTKV